MLSLHTDHQKTFKNNWFLKVFEGFVTSNIQDFSTFWRCFLRVIFDMDLGPTLHRFWEDFGVRLGVILVTFSMFFSIRFLDP